MLGHRIFPRPLFLGPMEARQNRENKQTHKIANTEQKPLSWYLVFSKFLGVFNFLLHEETIKKTYALQMLICPVHCCANLDFQNSFP